VQVSDLTNGERVESQHPAREHLYW